MIYKKMGEGNPDSDDCKETQEVPREALDRVRGLCSLATSLRYTDSSRAELLAREARLLCSSPEYGDAAGRELRDMRVSTLVFLGQLVSDTGRYEEALALLLEAVVLLNKNGGDSGLEGIHLAIGRIYYYIADYDEAGLHYRFAREMALRLGDDDKAAAALLNLGLCQFQRGKLPEAFATLGPALAECRGLGMKAGECIALDALANAHLKQGDYHKAYAYARASVDLSDEADIEHNRTDALCSLADALVGLGRNDEALAEAIRAESFAIAHGSLRDHAEALCRRGDILRRLGDLEAATLALASAVEVAGQSDSWRSRYRAEFALGVVLKESRRGEESYAHFQRFHELKEAEAVFDADMKLKTLALVHRAGGSKAEDALPS